MDTSSTMLTFAMLLCLVGVTRSKIFDLSHVHSPMTLMSSYKHPRFNRTSLSNKDMDVGVYVDFGWYSSTEHGGTHIDAPNHFFKGAMTLDQIPIEYTVLEGVMIDSAEEAKTNNEFEVKLEKVLKWEKENGRIPDNAAILFNFNWSRKANDEYAYKGTEDLDNVMSYKYPFVGEDVARWLLENRKPRLIGSDTMSPDPFQINGVKNEYPFHILYLPENRLIVESLRDLWQLPPRGFRFHGTPVAYKDNTGAQIRAFAMTYDQDGNSASAISPLSIWIITSLTLVIMSQYA